MNNYLGVVLFYVFVVGHMFMSTPYMHVCFRGGARVNGLK